MTVPTVLDLFSCAGGAAMGYYQAGFDVVGVDIEPQPNFPFSFLQEDITNWIDDQPAFAEWVAEEGFVLIHASPPCQRWAEAGTDRRLGEEHPDLLAPTREMLQATGVPYVIENIPTAPMPEAFLLCGRSFGLPVVRHRLFETSWPIGLVPSLCHQTKFARSVDHGPGFHPYAHGSWEAAWREHVIPELWPWMTLAEAGQAIPPAYTRWIGEQFLAQVSA